MPQNDRHKEREIPIEFDFYNTLESLPVDNRCTIIMISCGSTTVKINEHIQTVTAPTSKFGPLPYFVSHNTIIFNVWNAHI